MSAQPNTPLANPAVAQLAPVPPLAPTPPIFVLGPGQDKTLLDITSKCITRQLHH